jgi:nitroreductase
MRFLVCPVSLPRLCQRLQKDHRAQRSLVAACTIPFSRLLCCLALLGGSLVLPGSTAAAQGADESTTLQLPPPKIQGGKPLLDVLSQRRTIRELKPDPLSKQDLSNLLWAGFGINRPATGHRTAPSAMNSQEIDLYVALAEGLYLYEAKPNRLRKISSEDLRSRAGGQEAFQKAPVTLILVADLERLTKASPDTRPFYAAFDAGCISQNLYLFCASEGLASVVHDLDRTPLSAAMKLRPEQRIILAQAVAYPQEARPPN